MSQWYDVESKNVAAAGLARSRARSSAAGKPEDTHSIGCERVKLRHPFP